jgi:hypothetical protein
MLLILSKLLPCRKLEYVLATFWAFRVRFPRERSFLLCHHTVPPTRPLEPSTWPPTQWVLLPASFGIRQSELVTDHCAKVSTAHIQTSA